VLSGGAGDDHITAGTGPDDIAGGDGDDVIDARNGAEDSIDCGAGVDTVIVDAREDGVLDCENVQSP
jgi:Ca2+-binding RTX toxin-like protein